MTYTLETIPRVKAGTVADTIPASEINQERSYLAQRAADVLGYKVLKASVHGHRTLSAVSGPLTEGLLKLGVDILDTAAVLTYQLDELTRRNRETIEENFSQYACGWFTLATWNRTELSQYERPVPEFVIDKALKIKEAIPEVHFYIQHLSDPKADPFLIARVNSEIYYIDAWDEPRFEASL